MPKVLKARRPTDRVEEYRIRRLARSRGAPVELVQRARTIVLSWDGADTADIATKLDCHRQTVRTRISRFNALGLRSVVDRSGAGRKPRLTEAQRRELVALVTTGLWIDPGRPASIPIAAIARGRSPSWTLDSLVEAASERGIEVRRSQLRRILLAAGLQWHPVHSWSIEQLAELDLSEVEADAADDGAPCDS
jgi:transposase